MKASQPIYFGAPTRVMGIVNVTPDSFHDGGRYFSTEAAVRQGVRLAAEGAEVLDIGGESTRPGAAELSVPEELGRVLPVISELSGRIEIPISVDTWKAAVASRALEAGASWINDVSGGRRDPEMLSVAAGAGVPYVAMHMRGTPQTMQQLTGYDDIIVEITEYFKSRLAAFEAAGGRRERMLLDPGIGFAKTPADNYTLLAGLRKFRGLGQPLLVGPSRKSFLKLADGETTEERLPGTIAAVTVCALAGVEVVRVHDVKEVVQAVKVARMIRERAEDIGE